MLASVSPTSGKSKTGSDGPSDKPADDTSAQQDSKASDAKSLASASPQGKAAPQSGPSSSNDDVQTAKADDTASDADALANIQANLQALQPSPADPALIPPVALPAFAPPTPPASNDDDGDQDDATASIGQTDAAKSGAVIGTQTAAAQPQGQGQVPGRDATVQPAGAAPNQAADTPAVDFKALNSKITDIKASDAKKAAAKAVDAKTIRKPSGAAADPQAAQAGKPDIKTDGIKTGDIKTADANTSDIKADALASASTPAPATDSAAARTAIASPGILAASAVSQTTASAATTLVQQVQVTTTAQKPNLPALAVEIAAKSLSGAKQFDIRLDPPELGRVDVRLSIDATGKASAHLSADQPQTLDLLQKDSTSLTRALRDAGLDVSQDGLNFSLRQQTQQNTNGNGQDGQRQTGGSARNFTATASIEATAAAVSYRVATDGRLDIRV